MQHTSISPRDHTRQLRAVEHVAAGAWQEFGEDPLLPELRDILDKGREQLADLHTEAEKSCGPCAACGRITVRIVYRVKVVLVDAWEQPPKQKAIGSPAASSCRL